MYAKENSKETKQDGDTTQTIMNNNNLALQINFKSRQAFCIPQLSSMLTKCLCVEVILDCICEILIVPIPPTDCKRYVGIFHLTACGRFNEHKNLNKIETYENYLF